MHRRKVTEVINYQTACPKTWMCKLEDGCKMYIRYEYDWLSVRVSEEPCDSYFFEGIEPDYGYSLEEYLRYDLPGLPYEKLKEAIGHRFDMPNDELVKPSI